MIGAETGKVTTFDEFMSALKTQIAYITERPMSFVRAIEKEYHRINPDLILSAQYDRCVELGVDAYEGSAK